MVSSFKNIVIGSVLTGMFLLAMIMFGANLALDNNPNQTILNDDRIARLNDTLTSELSAFNEQTSNQKNASFGQPAVQANNGFTVNIIPTVVVLFQMPIIMWNVLSQGAQQIIGVPLLFLNIIGAVILISIILLGWRVIRAGA